MHKGSPLLKRAYGSRADPDPWQSAHMTETINLALGCHYFLPGPQLSPPPAEHHRSLAGTKLYCLVTEARVCKQLAQGCTRQRGGRDSNPRPVDRKSGSLTTQPPNHTVYWVNWVYLCGLFRVHLMDVCLFITYCLVFHIGAAVTRTVQTEKRSTSD